MATKNYMINDKWLDLDKQNIVELQSVDGVLDSLKVNGSEIETPSGKITITENGTDIDVAQYALADVNVEGGGGSSDFSTAEVTLINNYGGVEISLIAPTYVDSEEISTSINYITAQPNETITQNAFLYKNSCFAEIKGFEQLIDPEPLVTVSGNVVYEGDGFFTITGDCTITIS